jgi:methylmalonyl-CoA mutase cobalamin-binding subunit
VTDANDRLSIGDLARASGVAVGTIRAWETRYGRPTAERLPSGHRRYRASEVRWLRGVAEAVARGHRPSEVARLTAAALDALLRREAEIDAGPSPDAWVALARAYDAPALSRALRSSWERLGSVAFLDDRLAPFLAAVGRGWADGGLSIRHEHWVTEVVEDFLRARRRRTRVGASRAGRRGLLATLPGERHGLPLQMAALVCAERGIRVRLLGPDVPAEEIALAAREARAGFVGVSVSLATGGVDADRALADLRARLPASVRFVAGGEGLRGPRRVPPGVEAVASMRDLDAWLVALPRGGAR